METQPKFKFGDWLQEEGSRPFCVGIIHRTDIDYFYSDEAHKPFHFVMGYAALIFYGFKRS